MSYHPTIWRTCRVLANRRRLACLRAVLQRPGLTVGDVATAAGLPDDQASLCLRALQARGLLHGSRVSRWVHYYPAPDPLVPVAAPILDATRRALLKARMSEPQIISCLTAFTHPRRLSILRTLLRSGHVGFSGLARAGQMSEAALFRHLMKLSNRGIVVEEDDKWTLCPRPSALARSFLLLIANHPGT